MERLEDLWRDGGPTHVRVGDVVDRHGKALDVRRLLMRRWGWPKKAAERASVWLEGDSDAIGFLLPVKGPDRNKLQRRLLAGLPDLLDDLLEGIANRAHREEPSAGVPLSQVTVIFRRETPNGPIEVPLKDEGFVSSVISVVAGRLGVSVEELRHRLRVEREAARMTLTVLVDEG